MTRLTSVLLLSLALTLLPLTSASAATAPAPCAGGGLGFGSHDTPVTPDYTPIVGTVDHQFRIDLSDQQVPDGQLPITSADVNVVLSWTGSPVSDYDMTVNGTDVWNNPIPPGNSEEFQLDAVKHCALIDVTVWTYIGAPIDTVKLTLDVAA